MFAVSAELASIGVWLRPSDYGEPYPITRQLLEEGRAWSVLNNRIVVDGKVRVLQGEQDPDVPWRHAQRLAESFSTPDVAFTLIKDGDYRLSRDQDLARPVAAVEEVG